MHWLGCRTADHQHGSWTVNWIWNDTRFTWQWPIAGVLVVKVKIKLRPLSAHFDAVGSAIGGNFERECLRLVKWLMSLRNHHYLRLSPKCTARRKVESITYLGPRWIIVHCGTVYKWASQRSNCSDQSFVEAGKVWMRRQWHLRSSINWQSTHRLDGRKRVNRRSVHSRILSTSTPIVVGKGDSSEEVLANNCCLQLGGAIVFCHAD